MWSRSELKYLAKGMLSQNYGTLFAISLIVGLLSGGGGAFSSLTSNLQNQMDGSAILALIVAIFGLLGSLFTIFVGFPVQAGGAKAFLDATQGFYDVSGVFYYFKEKRYSNTVLVMFLTNLFIGLWSLLLIIPGIIKAYAYRMVPYILAENPAINYKTAMQLSDRMTLGHKMDMFVLELSFIGWTLLGVAACGFGVLFVQPYVQATQAHLYLQLKGLAMQKGLFTQNDFYAI